MNLRRHVWRSALRVCALLVSDTGAFLILRTALRAARHLTAFGNGEVQFIRWMFADGYLGGWQYAAALIISLVLTGNYGPGDSRRNPMRLFIACALATALPLWARLWTDPLVLTASRYVLTVVPACMVLIAIRSLFDYCVVRFAPHPHAGAVARTLLVGRPGDCIDMRSRHALTGGGFHVLGYVDVQPTPPRGALGSLDDLDRLLVEHRVDTLILCGAMDDNAVVRVMRAAMMSECQVLTAARRFELAGVAPAIVWRRGQPFIMLRTVALRWHQLVLKRLLDIVLSATALAILSPLMAIIALAVRLESPGPVFFRQRRLRRHGQAFGCYKFRSMYPDAEERLRRNPELYRLYVENDYKLPEAIDTRVTRVGRFLRRTSLDELPQLWNVLRGDMSMVGPRPVVPEELQRYGRAASLYLRVKPGLTGLWQVSGRNDITYSRRVELDGQYIRDWSAGLDILILLRTVRVVLLGKGAY